MRLDLGSLQFYGISLEALTQAAIITILAIAIVLSNLLIIATYINFKGKSYFFHVFIFFDHEFQIPLLSITTAMTMNRNKKHERS